MGQKSKVSKNTIIRASLSLIDTNVFSKKTSDEKEKIKSVVSFNFFIGDKSQKIISTTESNTVSNDLGNKDDFLRSNKLEVSNIRNNMSLASSSSSTALNQLEEIDVKLAELKNAEISKKLEKALASVRTALTNLSSSYNDLANKSLLVYEVLDKVVLSNSKSSSIINKNSEFFEIDNDDLKKSFVKSFMPSFLSLFTKNIKFTDLSFDFIQYELESTGFSLSNLIFDSNFTGSETFSETVYNNFKAKINLSGINNAVDYIITGGIDLCINTSNSRTKVLFIPNCAVDSQTVQIFKDQVFSKIYLKTDNFFDKEKLDSIVTKSFNLSNNEIQLIPVFFVNKTICKAVDTEIGQLKNLSESQNAIVFSQAKTQQIKKTVSLDETIQEQDEGGVTP